MDLKYKVVFGYETERHISISADELKKAYGVFLGGGRAVFKEGAVDGKYIQAIMPDYHATMGWNTGYKLSQYDYEELRESGIDRKLRDFQNTTKDEVQALLSAPTNHLLE